MFSFLQINPNSFPFKSLESLIYVSMTNTISLSQTVVHALRCFFGSSDSFIVTVCLLFAVSSEKNRY